MSTVWMVLVILLILALCYIIISLIAYSDAKAQVVNAPREPMYWCPKGHGYFRMGHCLNILGTPVCPECYAQAVWPEAYKQRPSLWKKVKPWIGF